ncbi:MAG: hypothetical protein R3Y43_03710 [Alphaproteobacteria bacterium]
MNKSIFTVFMLLSTPAFASHGPGPFYQDSHFWVAISFVLVICLIAKPVGKAVVGMLKGKINSVVTAIENASNLRNDAQKLLLEYEKKQKNVKQEVDAILKDAKEQTSLLKKEALAKIDAELKQKENELASKISVMENNAKEEITNIIADKVMANVKDYVAKKNDAKTQEKFVNKVIENL